MTLRGSRRSVNPDVQFVPALSAKGWNGLFAEIEQLAARAPRTDRVDEVRRGHALRRRVAVAAAREGERSHDFVEAERPERGAVASRAPSGGLPT